MFDFNKYIKLIDERQFDEARDFKDKNIPKTLYKFISLNNPTNCVVPCIFDNISKTKINSIKNNKFWLSTAENLNDPFELKSFYITEEKIKKHNYPIEVINQLIKSSKNILIGCFTTKFLDNLPMWAHYANNHSGICVEYEIKKPQFFFPISYEETRVPANVVLMNCASLINKRISGVITEKELSDLEFYQSIIFHNNLIKDISWRYEDEYRLIYPSFHIPDNILKDDGGVLLDNDTIGLKIKNIYLGMNCTDKYKEEIKCICKNLNIGLYQVFLNDNNNCRYMLDYKEIL